MPPPSRRVHARFACELPVTVWTADAKTELAQGICLNIGMGGALFSCAAALQKGSPYLLRFGQSRKTFDLPGRVTHEQKKPGTFGFSFELNAKQTDKMRLVLDKVRAGRPDDKIGEKLQTYWGV